MLQITVPVCYAGLGGWLIHREGHHARRPVITLLAIALLLHAGLLAPLIRQAGAQALTIGHTLSLVALAMAIAACAGIWRAHSKSLAGLVLILSAALTAATGVGQGETSDSSMGWPLLVHVVLSILSYALLTIAALTAVALAMKDRALRLRQPSAATRLFVSMEALETQLFSAIAAGFVLLTLAIFSGLIYVDNMFAQHLVHKTVLSIASWILFGLLLVGRWRFGWRARTAANWTLGGFFVLLLAYYGSRLVLEVVLGRQWG